MNRRGSQRKENLSRSDLLVGHSKMCFKIAIKYLTIPFILSQLYRNWEKIARTVIIVGLLGIVVEEAMLLWIGDIYLEGGLHLRHLEDAKNHLERDNLLLEDLIAGSSSLMTIQNKSKALGFKKIDNLVWIK